MESCQEAATPTLECALPNAKCRKWALLRQLNHRRSYGRLPRGLGLKTLAKRVGGEAADDRLPT